MPSNKAMDPTPAWAALASQPGAGHRQTLDRQNGMAVVAIDWSGARRVGRKMWLAEAHGGQLVRLAPLISREAAADEVISFCKEKPDAIVGLDFAFSMPSWFLRKVGVTTAFELWALAATDGEHWLRECASPFWGRPGKSRPSLLEHYRTTERNVAAVGGISPKSCFQIGGAGAVGTGSIRGMPFLLRIREAGISVWPFDPPTLPVVIEIYPRILTGAVNKSSAEARREYLAWTWGDLPAEFESAMVGSEDAFDAAVSALVLDRHRTEVEQLSSCVGAPYCIEGVIWAPGDPTSCPTSASSRRRAGRAAADPQR